MIFWFLMWSVNNLLGLSKISCVIVPAWMKGVRSWGILGVSGVAAVWLANLILCVGSPILNGVMSTGSIFGPPLTVKKLPWASMVVPWGIDAIRATVSPRGGTFVAGT